jgi:hypothetical protein
MKPDLQALSVYVDESFVNSQEAGALKTKQYNKNKQYIELKSSKKQYLVRTDKQQKTKYILINGDKVQLNLIKGQFIYMK